MDQSTQPGSGLHKDEKPATPAVPSPPAFDHLLEKAPDTEAQRLYQFAGRIRSSFSSRIWYLSAYFILNLALTLSNKAVLQKAHFPWLLTALHSASTSLGCYLMRSFGAFNVTKLNAKDHFTLVAFSVLFTLNIALSNVSLDMISVPLHQILRSTCPFVTILIYRIRFSQSYSPMTYMSMVPLIVGPGLATAGDYHCTRVGFFCTILGVIFASVKTVVTNQLMTGALDLSPIELLSRISPLATVQCGIYAVAAGETESLRTAVLDHQFSSDLRIAIVLNVAIAVALNLVSFQANKATGALTMTVCSNVKQALTIGLGFALFRLPISWLNATGTSITILGAV